MHKKCHVIRIICSDVWLRWPPAVWHTDMRNLPSIANKHNLHQSVLSVSFKPQVFHSKRDATAFPVLHKFPQKLFEHMGWKCSFIHKSFFSFLYLNPKFDDIFNIYLHTELCLVFSFVHPSNNLATFTLQSSSWNLNTFVVIII